MGGRQDIRAKMMAKADAQPKNKTNPIKFIKEVKAEGKKVVWPSRQETTVSMIAVFIMVFIMSVFLYFSDQLIAYVVRLIMGFGA